MSTNRIPSSILFASVLAISLGACSSRGPSEFATYRLSGYLAPNYPSNCGECSVGLVLRGYRVDLSGVDRHFSPSIASSDFHFRWGVVQEVEIESWNESVPEGLMDDPGLRERMVRVVSEHPIAAGTRFPLPFRAAPGAYSIKMEREGNAVRLRDSLNSVLLECPDPAVCDAIAGIELGERAFSLDLEYTGQSDRVLAHAVTFAP
ncbi:MAG: hypothetical protein QM765_40180 [Myxococcales bacterium]